MLLKKAFLRRSQPLSSTLKTSLQKRAFTTELMAVAQAQTSVAELIGTQLKKQDYPVYKTLPQLSRALWDKNQALQQEEQEWLKTLTNPSGKQAFFSELAQIKDEDHEHLKYIKKKINKLVKQELEYLGFLNQISEKELGALSNHTLQEVKSKSNFYFAIDDQKLSKNLKIFNPKAPGNIHRHPSVIIPHEEVHVQHWINTKDLNGEKLEEIYAYYSHLIDLHISQVRPQNLTELSYIPFKYNQLETTKNRFAHANNMFFEFYHRWREPTRKWFSKTQEIDFQEALKNRPKTHHYDHDKGSKYDVEWTEDQKFPHVADRLGYPILREEPIERILGFERAPAHPGYQFQPFVQTPSMDPDPTLNFELGETIYENRQVVEWVRFWKVLTAVVFGASPAFYTFEIYAADGAPSLSWMADSWNFWQIPQQFQDGCGWGLEGIRYCDDHDYMNLQYGGKRMIARPAHTFYMATVLALLQNINFDYVSKMTYNKDKDLVFVYKPDGFWGETEYVYEMHHLEQMVPAPVTAYKDMSMQRDDGILSVHCMSTKHYCKFYGEDKYWNMNLKEDFLGQTRSLWQNRGNKYEGTIFQLAKIPTAEDSLTQLKIDRELQAAVAKHGEVKVPPAYEDQFFEKINRRKEELKRTALGAQ